MKRKLVLLAVLFVLPTGSAFAANWLISQPCGCAISTPIPDPSTQAVLDNFGNTHSPTYIGPYSYNPGDTVTICNGLGCSTYSITDNHLYSNGQYQPAAGHPSGGGGGGSGSNGGGGISLGGGTGGTGGDEDCHCNPTVTVGTA